MEAIAQAIARFAPEAIVFLDPPSLPDSVLHAFESLCEPLHPLTLGMLVTAPKDEDDYRLAAKLHRLVCFDPALSGSSVGETSVWRAVPPPVSDRFFAPVRPLHRTPRIISIGRSTPHREAMLMPSKHDHDLLQVIGGLPGAELSELLDECEVGVYIAASEGGSFDHQVPVHLAAGHLLLSEALAPTHGLERDIDYLCIDSPESLAWVLHRLKRFPEMYERLRVRGRMKAEQFRASKLFARLLYDLEADVKAFGSAPACVTPRM